MGGGVRKAAFPVFTKARAIKGSGVPGVLPGGLEIIPFGLRKTALHVGGVSLPEQEFHIGCGRQNPWEKDDPKRASQNFPEPGKPVGPARDTRSDFFQSQGPKNRI